MDDVLLIMTESSPLSLPVNLLILFSFFICVFVGSTVPVRLSVDLLILFYLFIFVIVGWQLRKTK